MLCHGRLLPAKKARLWALQPILVMDSRMKITVKLFAVLQLDRFREKPLDYPFGTQVGDVINDLDLPAEHVDILLVNGSHVDREYLLQDGDVLSLLPMVEGG